MASPPATWLLIIAYWASLVATCFAFPLGNHTSVTVLRQNVAVAVCEAGEIWVSTTDGKGPFFPRSSGTQAALRAIHSRDDIVVAVGDSATVTVSFDNGDIWGATERVLGSEATLRGVAVCSSDEIIVVVGDGGSIFWSADWGESFEAVGPASTADYHAIAVSPRDRLLVVGADGSILVSDNCGATWLQQTLPLGQEPLVTAAWIDDARAVAVARDATVYLSTDGARTWARPGTGNPLAGTGACTASSVVAIPSSVPDGGITGGAGDQQQPPGPASIVIACGNARSFLTSHDGGASWSLDRLNPLLGAGAGAAAVAALPGGVIVAVGPRALWLTSGDAGRSWSLEVPRVDDPHHDLLRSPEEEVASAEYGSAYVSEASAAVSAPASSAPFVDSSSSFPSSGSPRAALPRTFAAAHARRSLLDVNSFVSPTTVEGINMAGGTADPAVALSPTIYVQVANSQYDTSAFFAYSRSTGLSLAAGYFTTAATNLNCKGRTLGQPFVTYDSARDRFIVLEHGKGNYLCIYTSKTGNPADGWRGWHLMLATAFTMPQLAVWGDVYYISMRVTAVNLKPRVLALDAATYWAGNGSTGYRVVNLYIPTALAALARQGVSFAGVAPASSNPPSGACGQFFRPVDDEVTRYTGYTAVAGKDAIEVFTFCPNFANASASVLLLNQTVRIAEFSTLFCASAAAVECLEQAGSTVKLLAGHEGINPVLSYRNFNSTEVVVGAFTVNAASALNLTSTVTRAGIRWFELRRSSPTANWVLYQEGLHAPNANYHRFLPSIALDAAGNVALGYAITSSTSYVSVAYTGRAADSTLSLGTMAVAQGVPERILVNGSAVSANSTYGQRTHFAVHECDLILTGPYLRSSSPDSFPSIVSRMGFPTCEAAAASYRPNATATNAPLGGGDPCATLVCGDGNWCNGAETCDSAAGRCVSPTRGPCVDLAHCDEAGDKCLACISDAECDNGAAMCDGKETCVANVCVPGTGTGCPKNCILGVGCVDCSSDVDCDNGKVCDGRETCDVATHKCVAGTPCALACDEVNGCVQCLQNSHCSDGLYCNGAETCDLGRKVCVPAASGACAGNASHPYCDESGDKCVRCVIDAHCDDGLYCNGDEACVGGVCVASSGGPCDGTGKQCLESAGTCVDCLVNSHCDDGKYCPSVEACVANTCVVTPRCSGATPHCLASPTDVSQGSCAACLTDAHCDDGNWCNGNETCGSSTRVCQAASSTPCGAGPCNSYDRVCAPAPQLVLDSSFRKPVRVWSGLSLGGDPPSPVLESHGDIWLQATSTQYGNGKVLLYQAAVSAITSNTSTTDSGSGSFLDVYHTDPACQDGRGSPLIAADGLANRIFLAEVGAANKLCLLVATDLELSKAVVKPYSFALGATPAFVEPQVGVWGDLLLFSTFETETSGSGRLSRVYVVEKSRLNALQDARPLQTFTGPALSGYVRQGFTPVDTDGVTPAVGGSCGLFLRPRDDELHGSGLADGSGATDPARDYVELWELCPNWDSPLLSRFRKVSDIGVAEFDSKLCGTGASGIACLAQPGTTVKLVPHHEGLLYRAQYMQVVGASHESIVGAFVVNVGGALGLKAGIRWFELRRTTALNAAGTANVTSAWGLYQEGTAAAPSGSTTSFFGGSIGMDAEGNIALTYTAVGPSQAPEVRYTGRRADDPRQVMEQGEMVLSPGTVPYNASSDWGPSSSTRLNLVDRCSFAITSQDGSGAGQKGTRNAIVAFGDCDVCLVCNDGRACNGAEGCDFGRCVQGPPPCPTSLCDESLGGVCVQCLADTDCSDSQLCNGIERCMAGKCVVEPACPVGKKCSPTNGGQCVDCLVSSDCDDGNPCTGVETCSTDLRCVAGTSPCPPDHICELGAGGSAYTCVNTLCLPTQCLCDAGMRCYDIGLVCNAVTDSCAPPQCSMDSDCDNGVFCDGRERCVDETCRGADSVPCNNGVCSEDLDACLPQMEAGRRAVSVGQVLTVGTVNGYQTPVVVATLEQADGDREPLIVRVGSITGTSFQLLVGTPEGTPAVTAVATVHYLVVEAGAWEAGGKPVVEAKRLGVPARVDSAATAFAGAPLSLALSFRNPVVVGQAAHVGDLSLTATVTPPGSWSVFFARGSDTGENAVSRRSLQVGHHCGSNAARAPAAGTVELSVIVFEATGANHDSAYGVVFEAGIGTRTVAGAADHPPYGYRFKAVFAAAPAVAVVGIASVRSSARHAGWAQLYGPTHAELLHLSLQRSVGDGDAGPDAGVQGPERVSYVAFRDSFVLARVARTQTDGGGLTGGAGSVGAAAGAWLGAVCAGMVGWWLVFAGAQWRY
eukprot:jgi/Mesvir1/6144/Mv00845-RA.1